MVWFADILFVAAASSICWLSARRILLGRSKTLADYAIVVVWVFNCLPILLDLAVGHPDYSLMPWLSRLAVSVESDVVSLTYDAYNLVVLWVLAVYARRAQKRLIVEPDERGYRGLLRGPVLVLVLLLPFLLVLVSGNIEAFAQYASLGRRVSGFMYEAIGAAVLVGLYVFFIWYFQNREGKLGVALLLAYCAGIAWIDGKRYIVALMALLALYFFMNSSRAKPINISRRLVLIIAIGAFAAFYVLYALEFKPAVSASFEGVYLASRVDFGRDDVVKFVLDQELRGTSIVPYRGATILSALLMFVPRSLWPAKPYPHYRYLTAAMFGTDVLRIPAGMTPSLFETSVANCGVVAGVLLTCAVLVALCWVGDRSRSVPRKALYLVIVVTLLTQSLDAITGLLFVFYIGGVTRLAATAVLRSRK